MKLDPTIENPLEHEAPEVEPKNFWAHIIDTLEDEVKELERLERFDNLGAYKYDIAETQMYLDYAKQKMEEDK